MRKFVRIDILIRIILLLFCVLIFCGKYALQRTDRNTSKETAQRETTISQTPKYPVSTNEYQTKFQNYSNTYDIKDGTLYTMGDNLNGQLGNGTARPVVNEFYAKEGTLYSSEPVHLMDDIAYIAADHVTAAAITKKGDLWVWSDNSFGEIGNKRRGNGMPGVSTDVFSEPYLVLKKIKSVRFEDYTVYAVDFQDQEYCWGKNATAYPKPVETE